MNKGWDALANINWAFNMRGCLITVDEICHLAIFPLLYAIGYID